MIKLTDLILEKLETPKAVVMAGGGAVGKTYVLNQLHLSSLPQFNPDKYVEDPSHPYYNKLGPAASQVTKDVAAASNEKTNFVWDTTASNPKRIQELKDKGYDIYMVMVYAHPMISYAANFERKRNIPSTAVFSTWRNIYQLIGQYQQMLNGNLSVYVSDRGGKYTKEIAGFDQAAKSGVSGIKDYLISYNDEKGIEGSSFFTPVVMSKEEEEAFNIAVADVEYNRDNRSEDKAVKKVFLKAFQKNGVSPGDDKLDLAAKKYRESSEKRHKANDDVLENIAEMLFSPQFQELLEHSDIKEIDSRLQSFLA
tara:strand:- start:1242 stop:2171 length:930 start_codon:yes stop_codon:yes gene_type:complete